MKDPACGGTSNRALLLTNSLKSWITLGGGIIPPYLSLGWRMTLKSLKIINFASTDCYLKLVRVSHKLSLSDVGVGP